MVSYLKILTALAAAAAVFFALVFFISNAHADTITVTGGLRFATDRMQ